MNKIHIIVVGILMCSLSLSAIGEELVRANNNWRTFKRGISSNLTPGKIGDFDAAKTELSAAKNSEFESPDLITHVDDFYVLFNEELEGLLEEMGMAYEEPYINNESRAESMLYQLNGFCSGG